MRSDQVLFLAIDFPRQATDFLHGMIRAQIDRLTPWPANEAVFGITRPVPADNERIALTLAATSKQRIEPLVRLAADFGAASLAGLVEAPDAGSGLEPVKVFDRRITNAAGTITDVPRVLRLALLGAGLATVTSLAVTAYAGMVLDAEQQELQQRIAQRRAALRFNQGSGSAEALLAKRKQTSPSSVMVLEAVSSALPDTTYVTELRVEGDKMQVVGLTSMRPFADQALGAVAAVFPRNLLCADHARPGRLRRAVSHRGARHTLFRIGPMSRLATLRRTPGHAAAGGGIVPWRDDRAAVRDRQLVD